MTSKDHPWQMQWINPVDVLGSIKTAVETINHFDRGFCFLRNIRQINGNRQAQIWTFLIIYDKIK